MNKACVPATLPFQHSGQFRAILCSFQWLCVQLRGQKPQLSTYANLLNWHQSKPAPREMPNQGPGLHFLFKDMLTKQEETETNTVKLTLWGQHRRKAAKPSTWTGSFLHSRPHCLGTDQRLKYKFKEHRRVLICDASLCRTKAEAFFEQAPSMLQDIRGPRKVALSVKCFFTGTRIWDESPEPM